jgi:hypothetical protein
MRDDRGWSEVPDDDEDLDRADPARRLTLPAVGLIVVAVIGFLSNCLSFAILNELNRDRRQAPPPANMSKEEKEGFEAGRKAAPAMDACLMGVPTIAIYGLVLTGGIVMQRGRARGLAITGAILAMMPCGAGFLVGLPVGIWAMVVLFNPDVAAVFRRRNRRRRREEW